MNELQWSIYILILTQSSVSKIRVTGHLFFIAENLISLRTSMHRKTINF
jgi:hypothetical protein